MKKIKNLRKNQLLVSSENSDYTNTMVEAALYTLATGYTTTEIREVTKGERTEITTITKQEPPNMKAIELWLFNRLPERWNKEPKEDTTEKLKAIFEQIDQNVMA